MKRLSGLLLWLVLNATGLAAERYTLDAAHSQLGFRVRQYMSVVNGKFEDFSGTVSYDSAHPSDSRVEATIQVKSINTGITARDHHLLATDFFDAEKYPTMVFKSSSVQVIGQQSADVHGDLTMHGKTLPVVIHVELLSKDPTASDTLSWKVTAHLRRSEFGLKWNPVVEAASGISDDIDIQMRIATPAR
jgi:polyisoprenoid-binding protein YceI